MAYIDCDVSALYVCGSVETAGFTHGRILIGMIAARPAPLVLFPAPVSAPVSALFLSQLSEGCTEPFLVNALSQRILPLICIKYCVSS